MRPDERWMVAVLLLFTALPVASAQAAAPTQPPSSSPGATASGAARPDDADAGEGDELEALMSILDEETELATRNRMNRDYVPGVVTVLQGDELEALGIETAWEAVSLVPGIQTARDEFGNPTLVVRGIDFPFNSGNVKVLVNSAPLSWETAAINGSALYLPIEQVDRIEIIRGPGSVVYGDFAFMGLVNIITRSEGSGAYLKADSDQTLAGGARFTWGERSADPADRSLRATLDVAGLTSDEAALPALREGDEDRLSGTFTLEGGEFKLAAAAIDREVELSRNTNGTPVTTPTRHSETSWSIEPRWEHAITDRLVSTVRLTVLSNDLDTPGTEFESLLTEGAFEVQWEINDRNHLLGGIEAYTAEIDAFRTVQPPPPPPGGPPPPTQPPLVLENETRDVKSALLQDEFDLPGDVRITAGLRYDDTSDVDDRVTPRLAVVWRASERHVLKGQYAEGFRAPTFFELFRAGGVMNDLDYETVATTELNWVYTLPASTFRLTLFDAQLDDMIFVVRGTPLFRNYVEAQSQGVEAEWERELARNLKLIVNAAVADTEDGRILTTSPEPSPDPAEPDLLGNLALLWRPSTRSVVGLRWNHVGDREATGDDAYDLVEVTYTHPDLFTEGLSLRAGLDDVFDEKAVSIRPTPNGVARLTFPGQRLWFELEWTR